MKKLCLMICMFGLILNTAGGIVADTTSGEEQIQQQLEHQQKRLEEIEKYISRRRQEIEDFYRGALTELQLRAESEIRLLEVADKTFYTGLAAQTALAETVLQINGYERGPYSYSEAPRETIPRRLAVAQSRIAEKKNDISAKLVWETVTLQKQKRYALTVRLPELEKRLKQSVLAAKPETTHGLVTGVIYAGPASSAIIDGKIMHEADIIHGVKVVKIHRGKVEFEKDSRRWTQKVQQMPEPYWK